MRVGTFTLWPGERKKSNNILKFVSVLTQNRLTSCSQMPTSRIKKKLLAIIAEGFCVEFGSSALWHNGYWVPDWSPQTQMGEGKEKKKEIRRCKPGLPSCATYEMLPWRQLLHTCNLPQSGSCGTENKQQQNRDLHRAEDAHQKPSHCLCRRKARTLWPGNLLPQESSCFHFCPFPWRKARNATAYTQNNFTEKYRERTHVEAAGLFDCLARRGHGPGGGTALGRVCCLPAPVHLLPSP